MNIYDIAARTGVSIATVSRVLNASASVSPKTRDKVLAAMRAADYTPNIFARGLGLNSIKMIGLLCVDVADLYYASAVSILEKLLRAAEYDVLLYCTGNAHAEKQRCLARLLEKRVDAVFTIGSAFMDDFSPEDLRAAAARVPVILINARVEGEGVYSILCDEASATRACVQALHAAGCRRLLYLYDCDTSSGRAKRNGFLEAAQTLGIGKKALLAQAPRNAADAAALTRAKLAAHPEIDGVVTSEDLLAVGALQALQTIPRGTRAPVPVIGFNNSILAQCTLPTLTSVDNMVQPLCSAAVETLTALFKGEQPPACVTLAPRIVYRDSFAPPSV